MKEYIKPDIEVVRFEVTDVICTSTCTGFDPTCSETEDD